MKLVSLLFFTCAALLAPARAHAADVSGQWKASFDTAIGVQRYVFTFHVDGTQLTGKAVGERDGEKAEVVLTEGRVDGDQLSFVEPLTFQGQELRITYQGRLTGPDTIQFTRRVGDFATEEFAATRIKE